MRTPLVTGHLDIVEQRPSSAQRQWLVAAKWFSCDDYSRTRDAGGTLAPQVLSVWRVGREATDRRCSKSPGGIMLLSHLSPSSTARPSWPALLLAFSVSVLFITPRAS